jgi:hypothetical protein
MRQSGMDSCCFRWRTVITSCELGDEPSGSKEGRTLATSLVTVSFLTEVVMHGINLVINYKASSGSNAQNYIFRLLGNVQNDIYAHECALCFTEHRFLPEEPAFKPIMKLYSGFVLV